MKGSERLCRSAKGCGRHCYPPSVSCPEHEIGMSSSAGNACAMYAPYACANIDSTRSRYCRALPSAGRSRLAVSAPGLAVSARGLAVSAPIIAVSAPGRAVSAPGWLATVANDPTLAGRPARAGPARVQGARGGGRLLGHSIFKHVTHQLCAHLTTFLFSPPRKYHYPSKGDHN